MPKIAKPLKAIEISKLNSPGLHMVGTVSGLNLLVSPRLTKSWVLRTTIGSRRRHLGLGSYPEISLAVAHEKAREAKKKILEGIDPIEVKAAKKKHIEWTFKKCAETYIQSHQSSWKNQKHAKQWESTLLTYAFPKIGMKNVKDITLGDVLEVVEREWSTKNETMKRVLNRIELILGWAKVRGYREGENPAAWKNNLDQVLPKPSKVNKRTPHKSLGIDDAPQFWEKLKKISGNGARCLEFTILTACRSNESRGCTWLEIDLKNKEWRIPAERMKAGKEHRVPLSVEAIKILQNQPIIENCEFIFPGRNNLSLSDMSMTLILRRANINAVPHGFRATFATWAQERTPYSFEIRDKALAHTTSNKTTLAYERGDLFEKRRELMNDWAAFLQCIEITTNNKKFIDI